MTYEKELTFAKDIAKKAGEIMHQHYRGNQDVHIKADESPVTIADKTINTMLINEVKNKFPDHGVLGEEESWHSERTNLWVCDPIDGTVAYILHVPTAMFSLALVVNGEPVISICYNPWTDDLYVASKGGGATRNGISIKVSNRKWGERTQLAGASGSKGEPPNIFHNELAKNNIFVSNFLGTVFKGCLVAEGSIDGRTFMYKGAHDVAAIALLVKEAGGTVTDLEGNEQRYDQPVNGCVTSNSLIHNELLDLVKRAKT